MDPIMDVTHGKCRRKLSPENAIFAAGNALRITKYYQSMGLEDDKEDEEDVEEQPVVFVCRLFNCHGVGFRSLREYEEHYDLLHRNVCCECFRSFLSGRLLDLHLSETHDAFFRVLAKRQPMYTCLVDGCSHVFKHDDKRTKHLVADHQYPSTFSFHRVRRPPPHKTPATIKSIGPAGKPKDVDAVKIAKAHARKLKRREKKKTEARERKLVGTADADEPMETGVAADEEAMVNADKVEDEDLVQRMKQMMVPTSISFGRRQQFRR